MTLSAAETAAGAHLELWGKAGRSAAPAETGSRGRRCAPRSANWPRGARSGQLSHPCDVRFGRAVTQVLADAQQQLDARRG